MICIGYISIRFIYQLDFTADLSQCDDFRTPSVLLGAGSCLEPKRRGQFRIRQQFQL
jgi:hypothetical protein